MYNYSHNVDYLDKEIEEKYQSDFLSVWNLETYDNDIIMKKMEKFYNNIKTVPFVLFMLDTIKSTQSDNLLIQLFSSVKNVVNVSSFKFLKIFSGAAFPFSSFSKAQR